MRSTTVAYGRMTTNCVAVARPLVYGKGSAMSLTTLYGEMRDYLPGVDSHLSPPSYSVGG